MAQHKKGRTKRCGNGARVRRGRQITHKYQKGGGKK